MKLDEHELAKRNDPFLLKEMIMKSQKVRRIMLVDYRCIPKVITTLCGDPMMSYESIAGDSHSNSAAGQNYTDFWSMHNHTLPFNPFNRFWDNIYAFFAEVCCLELVKIN